MPRSAFYYQECPKCGRSLQVRVEYLGRTVVCRHCRGEFEARDPAALEDTTVSHDKLLDRANELLETVRVHAWR